MHHGSCLCGAIRYEVNAPIERITHCHCSMCRKAHGAAFGSYASVAASSFRFTAGANLVARYASSPTVIRSFCPRCGSTLQWLSSARAQWVDFAVGTLDTTLEPPSQQHIYAASKASWYHIQDSLPQAAGGLG